MKVTNKLKGQVFKIAHKMKSKVQNDWSLALKKAWELMKLGMRMNRGIVQFSFKKTNGDVVSYSGTLKNYKGKVCDFNVVNFIDFRTKQIRCFKIENLIFVWGN